MSFRCVAGNHAVGDRERPVTFVLAERSVIYEVRKGLKHKKNPETGKTEPVWRKTETSNGTEIAREVLLCTEHAEEHSGRESDMVRYGGNDKKIVTEDYP